MLDQAAEVGCLWIVFTGGEPLLRTDFSTIYRHAKTKGFLVIVMTNGSLITEEIVDLFRSMPPFCVDVTLYAYAPATYQQITGCDRGPSVYGAVERLQQHGIPVAVKTVILRQNAAEIDAIRSWAAERQIKHRVDADICPTLVGDQSPQHHRLPVEKIVEIGLARNMAGKTKIGSGNNTGKTYKAGERVEPHPAPVEFNLATAEIDLAKRFMCQAGKRSFYVGPDGDLAVCLIDKALANIKQCTLQEAWEGPLKQRTGEQLPQEHPCRECAVRQYCDACPPLLQMEAGSEDGVADPRCTLTHEYVKALSAKLEI